MEKENPAYYSILTAEVRYSKEITPLQKLLYSEITALSNKEGYCWASNSYFAKLYEVGDTWISKSINKLVKLGFLTSKIDTENGNIRYLAIALKYNTSCTKVQDPSCTKVQHNNTSSNNIINSNINITDKSVKKEWGNPDINKTISFLKEKLELPSLDGTIKDNRNYANLLIKKYKIEGVLKLIETTSETKFWRGQVTSTKTLYWNAMRILSSKREEVNNTYGKSAYYFEPEQS